MSIARTWVFPIIRLVIFAVIAVALAKLAFFSGAVATETNTDVPYAEIQEPQVEVARATVRNDVTLDATIAPKPAVAASATLTGEVTQVFVSAGDTVKKGDLLAQLSAELPIEKPKEDGPTTYKTYATVTAPVSGVLATFSALVGQSFGVGDPIGQVAPKTFIVTGTIPPEQLYRLVDKPKKATVQVNGGPAPFTCTKLTITAPTAGAADGESASGTTVTCSVPRKVTVFAGLAATVTVAGGVSENVLVVPATAIEGAAGEGNVYVLGDDGEPVAKPVKIGLSDGKNVEILDGLAEGDSVLAFVPGAPADDCSLTGECEGQG